MAKGNTIWNNYKNISKIVLFFLIFKSVSQSVAFGDRNDSQLNTNIGGEQRQANFELSTSPGNYNDYFENMLKEFDIESEHCSQKYTCSELLTFPDKLCHCDKLCGLMNDCCGNYGYTSTPLLIKDQFDCVLLKEIVINRDYGVTMVTKCSNKWEHSITKSLCEDVAETENILLKLPVSDQTELRIMYKNMYCAQCNFVNDFLYWKQEIKCPNETGVRSIPEMNDCILCFTRPRPEVSHRTCQLSRSIMSSCKPTDNITHELDQNCTYGVYAIVYDEFGMMYRNKYCAMCNGVVEKSMLCEQTISVPTGWNTTLDPRLSYSLRLIVDVNTGSVFRNGIEETMKHCKDNEMYDSFSQRCRELFCAPQFIATNSVCSRALPVSGVAFGIGQSPNFPLENCSLTKIDSSEFIFTNNSNNSLFIFSHQKVYSRKQFHVNGSDVFICLDKTEHCLNDCKDTDIMFYSDVIESYLTLAGLVVSILSLVITLIVYITFPKLLNTPGRILVSLIISLLLAQILFLTAFEVEQLQKACILVGVLVHYFFLATFCWMNVIAFDLWMTFSNRFLTPGSESKGRKRFIIYSLYAWLLPVMIVCTAAVVLDFIHFDTKFKSLKPNYGNRVCWLSSRDSLFLFFAGPLALFKMFDIICFISTAIHIARTKKQGAMATGKTNTCSFIVNLKLSLIMGLTWVFAFVANATNEMGIWYLFIIFNSLQGLFIAICFLCTKKVGRLTRDKYRQFTTKYASGTQNSSLV